MARTKLIVAEREQVLDNIRTYQTALKSAEGLQRRFSRHSAWYAIPDGAGGWIFGPSKFVGYADNDAEFYLKNSKERLDGKETEPVLSTWFKEVDLTSDLGQELQGSFDTFAKAYDKVPNKRWRVSLLTDPKPTAIPSSTGTDRLLERISSNPDVCGGRPCIRGTRMRVSDIVDMIGHGVSPAQIAADFPYIAPDDISASLIYAARAMDHPVVRAA